MSSGVTFWQFPDEESEFLEFLVRTGNILAIPSCPANSEDELRPTPIIDYIEASDPDQLLFGLEEDVQHRVLEPITIGGAHKVCVTSLTSNLISYRRGKYRDSNKLGQFNISVYWKHLNSKKNGWLENDPRFKSWSTRIIQWIRKHTPEWHQYKGYRITRRVQDALKSGRLEIVP